MVKNARAYLIWSPGFCRALVMCVVSELTVLGIVWFVPQLRELSQDVVAASQLLLLDGAHALAWWSAIALLASACCVIQVILAAASFGCSGLNSVLGPVRPALLSVTAFLQVASWRVVVSQKPEQAPFVALSTALTVLLSFSPELLALHESRRRKDGPASGTAGRRVVLTLAKVSCTVCETKVRELAEAHSAVQRCDVDIDNATASLVITDDANAEVTAAEVAAALAAGGYPLKSVIGAEAVVSHKEAAGASVWQRVACDPRLGGLIGGLLGSSCCAVQLCLNLLATLGVASIGCAGFNTRLGPLRPYTRAATATYFAVRYGATKSSAQRRRLILPSLIAALLTFMPELLLLSGGPGLAAPMDGSHRIDVPVTGMGCEACQHQVRSVLQRSSGVIDARVVGVGDDGVAQLLVHPRWGFNLAAITKEVGSYGFDVGAATIVPAAAA